MRVWNYAIEDDLKKIISIAYTNKIYILFGSLSLKNFTIKLAWLGVVMGWQPFENFFKKRMGEEKTC